MGVQVNPAETPTIVPRTPHEGLPVDSQVYQDSQWTPSGLPPSTAGKYGDSQSSPMELPVQ